ncbi:hypothetical protein HDU92_007737, partial [Lobulomyces angularis]
MRKFNLSILLSALISLICSFVVVNDNNAKLLNKINNNNKDDEYNDKIDGNLKSKGSKVHIRGKRGYGRGGKNNRGGGSTGGGGGRGGGEFGNG